MSAKHTPGPWIVSCIDDTERPGIDAYDLDFSIVIWGVREEENEGIHGRTPDEERANACLIAAAPDLLEALTRLRDAEKAPRGEWIDAIANADIVIAKAKGEAQ